MNKGQMVIPDMYAFEELQAAVNPRDREQLEAAVAVAVANVLKGGLARYCYLPEVRSTPKAFDLAVRLLEQCEKVHAKLGTDWEGLLPNISPHQAKAGDANGRRLWRRKAASNVKKRE